MLQPALLQRKQSPRFRKALWIALVINALMFVVEIVGGYKAQSVSLWADALDFAEMLQIMLCL